MYFTKRQLEVLDFIRRYRARHRLAPTLDEIAAELRVTKATILDHVKALEAKGAVRRTPHHARSIELIAEGEAPPSSNALPVLGELHGDGTSVFFDRSETFDLGRWLPDPSKLHLFRVRGNAFESENLADGDLLVIDRVRTPIDGDLVMRMNQDGKISLSHHARQPAQDSSYAGELRGVVLGSIRRHH